MVLRTATKGITIRQQFWDCSTFPDANTQCRKADLESVRIESAGIKKEKIKLTDFSFVWLYYFSEIGKLQKLSAAILLAPMTSLS